MPRFFRRLREGVFDENDVRRRADELADFVEEARGAYGLSAPVAVGFSNGAITIGVLLSNHDEFVLTHFRNFCLVDHGMFHLTDVHKERARGARFLILVGDRQDLGRDLKLRQSQLLHDAGRLLGVNVTHRVLKDTGHEFRERHMAIVGEWLRNDIR